MFMILLRQTLRQTNKHINGGCEVLRCNYSWTEFKQLGINY